MGDLRFRTRTLLALIVPIAIWCAAFLTHTSSRRFDRLLQAAAFARADEGHSLEHSLPVAINDVRDRLRENPGDNPETLFAIRERDATTVVRLTEYGAVDSTRTNLESAVFIPDSPAYEMAIFVSEGFGTFERPRFEWERYDIRPVIMEPGWHRVRWDARPTSDGKGIIFGAMVDDRWVIREEVDRDWAVESPRLHAPIQLNHFAGGVECYADSVVYPVARNSPHPKTKFSLRIYERPASD